MLVIRSIPSFDLEFRYIVVVVLLIYLVGSRWDASYGLKKYFYERLFSYILSKF